MLSTSYRAQDKEQPSPERQLGQGQEPRSRGDQQDPNPGHYGFCVSRDFPGHSALALLFSHRNHLQSPTLALPLALPELASCLSYPLPLHVLPAFFPH